MVDTADLSFADICRKGSNPFFRTIFLTYNAELCRRVQRSGTSTWLAYVFVDTLALLVTTCIITSNRQGDGNERLPIH